jgi:hypothetical protein
MNALLQQTTVTEDGFNYGTWAYVIVLGVVALVAVIFVVRALFNIPLKSRRANIWTLVLMGLFIGFNLLMTPVSSYSS